MEQQNLKKKMEKEISSLPLEKKTRKCWKCLILSCTVMHKILSKRHALMLIMQQIQILRIRNMVCTFSKIDKHYQTQKQFNVRSVINVLFLANVFFSSAQAHSESRALCHKQILYAIEFRLLRPGLQLY